MAGRGGSYQVEMFGAGGTNPRAETEDPGLEGEEKVLGKVPGL